MENKRPVYRSPFLDNRNFWFLYPKKCTSILLAPTSIIQIKQSLTTGQAAYEDLDLGSKIYQTYEIVYKL